MAKGSALKLAISRYPLGLEIEGSCVSLLYPMEVSRIFNIITTGYCSQWVRDNSPTS
jgi:hypothetical protein